MCLFRSFLTGFGRQSCSPVSQPEILGGQLGVPAGRLLLETLGRLVWWLAQQVGWPGVWDCEVSLAPESQVTGLRPGLHGWVCVLGLQGPARLQGLLAGLVSGLIGLV